MCPPPPPPNYRSDYGTVAKLFMDCFFLAHYIGFVHPPFKRQQSLACQFFTIWPVYKATGFLTKLQNTRPLVISYHVATISLDTRSELGNIIFRWIRGQNLLIYIYS